MGSTTIFYLCSLDLSLNCVLRVKVSLRAAVFYGFPYKLRPKPKIAVQDARSALRLRTLMSLTPNFDSVSGVNRFRSVPGLPFYPPERDCTTLDIIMVHPQRVSAYLTICCTPGTHRALHTRLCYFTLSTSLFFTQQTLE